MRRQDTDDITVIVVDDSALVRHMLTALLNADPRLEVVATAADPYQARELIKRHNPDVITLDIEMPRMDGLTFLRNLMRLRPMPVIMVSTLTEYGAPITLEALELGAFDFVEKPKADVAGGLATYADELVAKVVAAAGAHISPSHRRSGADLPAPPRDLSRYRVRPTETLVVIGASTGGVEAIRQVLCDLPPDSPGIVIVQHIPAAFSASFASRLDTLTAVRVCQARHGQRILTGHVYIAPGDRHLRVRCQGNQYLCEFDNRPPVSHHKPSVDVLFQSAARSAGSKAIGVILTGMGEDGARGMLEMKRAGAVNLAQDEASSVVWGMPGAAVHINAVDVVCPLTDIAGRIIALSGRDRKAQRNSNEASVCNQPTGDARK